MLKRKTVKTVLCFNVCAADPRLKSWVNENQPLTRNRFDGFDDQLLQEVKQLKIKWGKI